MTMTVTFRHRASHPGSPRYQPYDGYPSRQQQQQEKQQPDHQDRVSVSPSHQHQHQHLVFRLRQPQHLLQRHVTAFDTRKKLLGRLGLYPPTTLQTPNTPSLRPIAQPRMLRSSSLNCIVRTAQLNDHHEFSSHGGPVVSNLNRAHSQSLPSLLSHAAAHSDTPTASSSSSSSDDAANGHQNCSNRIRFNPNVTIISIPSRHEYSSRIHRQIWSDRYELQRLVEQNQLEFEYEGYDWQNVITEDDMVFDHDLGQYVHPCHFTADSVSRDDDCRNCSLPSIDDDGEEDDWDGFVPLRRQSSFNRC